MTCTPLNLTLFFVAAASVALAAPAAADEGPFGGFDLAVAVSNFDATTTESNPNIGALIAAEAGWRFDLGIDLGLSLGFSGAGFGFPVTVMVPPAMGGGETEVDADVALDMLEISGWIFVPVGESLELHGQIGGGPSSGQLSAGTTTIDKDGWGYLATAGLALRLQRNLVLVGEGYFRNYGFTIDEFEGFTDDLFTYGVTFGIGWRS
jgi:hypothetical protein